MTIVSLDWRDFIYYLRNYDSLSKVKFVINFSFLLGKLFAFRKNNFKPNFSCKVLLVYFFNKIVELFKFRAYKTQTESFISITLDMDPRFHPNTSPS